MSLSSFPRRLVRRPASRRPVPRTARFAGPAGGLRMIAKAESVSLVSSTPGDTATLDDTWTGTGQLVLLVGNQ